jgi:hypothetical protein
LFALVFPLVADDVSKAAKAGEVVSLIGPDADFQQAINAMFRQALGPVAGGSGRTSEQQARQAEFQAKLGQLVSEALSSSEVKAAFAAIYTEAFTEQELEGILAFYKSPSGRALRDKTPDLMTKSLELGQRLMVELQPKFEELALEYVRQSVPPPPRPAK